MRRLTCLRVITWTCPPPDMGFGQTHPQKDAGEHGWTLRLLDDPWDSDRSTSHARPARLSAPIVGRSYFPTRAQRHWQRAPSAPGRPHDLGERPLEPVHQLGGNPPDLADQ